MRRIGTFGDRASELRAVVHRKMATHGPNPGRRGFLIGAGTGLAALALPGCLPFQQEEVPPPISDAARPEDRQRRRTLSALNSARRALWPARNRNPVVAAHIAVLRSLHVRVENHTDPLDGTPLQAEVEAALGEAYDLAVGIGHVGVIGRFRVPRGPGQTWVDAWWDYSSP